MVQLQIFPRPHPPTKQQHTQTLHNHEHTTFGKVRLTGYGRVVTEENPADIAVAEFWQIANNGGKKCL